MGVLGLGGGAGVLNHQRLLAAVASTGVEVRSGGQSYWAWGRHYAIQWASRGDELLDAALYSHTGKDNVKLIDLRTRWQVVRLLTEERREDGRRRVATYRVGKGFGVEDGSRRRVFRPGSEGCGMVAGLREGSVPPGVFLDWWEERGC